MRQHGGAPAHDAGAANTAADVATEARDADATDAQAPQQLQQRSRGGGRPRGAAASAGPEHTTGKRQRQPARSPGEEPPQRSARSGSVYNAASTVTASAAAVAASAGASPGAGAQRGAGGGHRPATQHSTDAHTHQTQHQHPHQQQAPFLQPQHAPPLPQTQLHQQPPLAGLAQYEALELRRLSSPPGPSPSGASARPVAASFPSWVPSETVAAAEGRVEMHPQQAWATGSGHGGGALNLMQGQEPVVGSLLSQPAALSVAKQLPGPPHHQLPGGIRVRAGGDADDDGGAGGSGGWHRSPAPPPPGTATSASAAAAAQMTGLLNSGIGENEAWLGQIDPSMLLLPDADMECVPAPARTAAADAGSGGSGGGGRPCGGHSGGGSGGGGAISHNSSSMAALGASVSQLFSEAGPLTSGSASGAWSSTTAHLQLPPTRLPLPPLDMDGAQMALQELQGTGGAGGRGAAQQPSQATRASLSTAVLARDGRGHASAAGAGRAWSSAYGPSLVAGSGSPADSGGAVADAGSVPVHAPYERRSPVGHPSLAGQQFAYPLASDGGPGGTVYLHRFPGSNPTQLQRPTAGLPLAAAGVGDAGLLGSPPMPAAAQPRAHLAQLQPSLPLQLQPQQQRQQHVLPQHSLPPQPPQPPHLFQQHVQQQQRQPPHSQRQSSQGWAARLLGVPGSVSLGGGGGGSLTGTGPGFGALGMGFGMGSALRPSVAPLTDAVTTLGLGSLLDEPMLSACLSGGGASAGGGRGSA